MLIIYIRIKNGNNIWFCNILSAAPMQMEHISDLDNFNESSFFLLKITRLSGLPGRQSTALQHNALALIVRIYPLDQIPRASFNDVSPYT